MFSLAYIQELADQAARQASRRRKQPYVIYDEAEIDRFGFKIPNLGSHRPRGWKLIGTLLVDKFGFGASWEPALTHEQFKNRLKELERAAESEGKTIGYAQIEESQFQALIGVFEREPVKRSDHGDRERLQANRRA